VCFGTILAKTWRIYYIFTNPKPNKKKFTQNWVLIIFIIALVLVNICLTTILVAFPGGRTESTYGENAEKFSEEIDGFVYNYYSYVCTSLNYRIFLGIVFGFKALLQIAALFLQYD
jgi:gamma-aminobutyric acid type B receptor